MSLTFDELRGTNIARAKKWHPGFPEGSWTSSDWSNAASGELGEACNVVKKLRRIETGLPGAKDPPEDVLVRMLADEIADTVTYLDLLAAYFDIDMGEAIRTKFNFISAREGFPDRM